MNNVEIYRTVMHHYLLPSKLRESNVFSHVCLSFFCPHGGGVPTAQDPSRFLHRPLDKFKLVHYEARTVGKRAVGILLECFLVYLFVYVGAIPKRGSPLRREAHPGERAAPPDAQHRAAPLHPQTHQTWRLPAQLRVPAGPKPLLHLGPGSGNHG